MIYFLILFIIISLSASSTTGKHVGSWGNGKYVVLFLLTFIAGFAFMLGSDTPEYVTFFNRLPPLEYLTKQCIDSYRYQPGFTIFTSLVKSIYDNYLLFQIVHAILINVLIFRFINKFSKNPYVAVLAYCIINYLEFNFEIQRESIAIVLGLLAYEFVLNKKYIAYLITALIAYFFHFSALAILLYPLVLLINVSKKNSVKVLAIVAIAPWIWKAIPNAEAFLALSTDSEFYSGYINQDLNTNYNIFYFLSFYFTNLIIPVASLYILKDKLPTYSILVLMYILFKMLSMFSYGFYRFSNYFVCFYWLAIAESLYYLYQKYSFNKLFLYIVVLMLIGYTNQTKMFWYEEERGEYIYQRYFPYEMVDINTNY